VLRDFPIVLQDLVLGPQVLDDLLLLPVDLRRRFTTWIRPESAPGALGRNLTSRGGRVWGISTAVLYVLEPG
jgi:hypothetical protein